MACCKEDRTKLFPFIQLTLCVFSSVSNSNGLFSLLTWKVHLGYIWSFSVSTYFALSTKHWISYSFETLEALVFCFWFFKCVPWDWFVEITVTAPEPSQAPGWFVSGLQCSLGFVSLVIVSIPKHLLGACCLLLIS